MDKRQVRAFEGFAAESEAELLRIAMLLTSDPFTAEDVYQETLQRLAARWSRVDNPKAFCRRVMLNIVIDQARARARRPREQQLLGVAAGVIAIVPGSGGRPAHTAIKLTADQRVLYLLSSAAARQSQGQGRYVVLSEQKDGNLDTSVIDSITGDMWSYQKGFNGAPSGAGAVSRHWSPTAAQLAAMPLGQAALRRALINQYDQNWQKSQNAISPLRKRHIPGNVGPTGSDDDKVFEQATTMLWNPLVPPAMRSVLFRILAATPGVTVNASAHDMAGQPAVEISRTDSVSKVIYAAFEDPRTGGFLELTDTYPSNSDGSVSGYDLVLSVTRASAIPSDPYAG